MAVYVLRGVPFVRVRGRRGYDDVTDQKTLGPDVPGDWPLTMLEDLGAALNCAVECDPAEFEAWRLSHAGVQSLRVTHARGVHLRGAARDALLFASLESVR